ncbi:MAG: recombinase family protein [Pseudomonadota bacterium]
MPNAAIYARYSTDLQREASIEDQIRLCEERAALEGLTVMDRYADHGTSGASLMRPGVQALIADALSGRFDVVIAEAMDRLSRDQEDIAGLFKRLQFAGVRLITLSEGEVSNLHVGLKGTMNALFLQDLADKTRRGLRGRVEDGMSGGGNAYGYDVVHAQNPDGTVERGARRINPREAAVVTRIFEAYAAGRSPRDVVQALNEEGVPAPSGRAWGPSTIYGNRRRGTGILNNELYVGRLVWNRLRYVKDPSSGKRVSRLNPEEAWITQPVPELRIIDDVLWERVKARQGALKARSPANPGAPGFWDRRRPRHLLTGLMTCGVCGGGMIHVSKTRIVCAAARDKRTCPNTTTMLRQDLEGLILDGLERHLMTPERTEIFSREYTEHMNRLAAEANAGRDAATAELAKIDRDLERLVEAILDGVPGSKVKDRMAELEARKAELDDKLSRTEAQTVSLHPDLGAYYRREIGRLRDLLAGAERDAEAVELVRSLIERITLTPVEREDGTTVLSADLEGSLAGILALASGRQGQAIAKTDVVKLVAGVGFEPTTFRL